MAADPAVEPATGPSGAAEGRGAEPSAPTGTPDQAAIERDQYRDRLLRTAAEFENYRKRVERERREFTELAAADLLTALLPILDDLERALAIETAPEAEPFRKGIELIHRQLIELLTRRGVKPIEAVGADFDPRFHEAVVHEEAPGHRPGEVTGELRRGYTLGDRLLRASMVKVARS